MTSPTPTHYTPQQALAHGPGMVLLDEVLDWSAEHARCALRIRRNSRFFEDGLGVPGWVGIEYMAQTIGVWAGIQRLQAGREVIIGLLLGSRAYECAHARFAEGQRLVVSAHLQVHDADGVGVFACTLGDGAEVWARSDIKAFQPNDIAGYLESLNEEAA